MQDEILKKMMCCEADLGEIANLIQILKNCTEKFNSEIWKIVNKYNPEFI